MSKLQDECIGSTALCAGEAALFQQKQEAVKVGFWVTEKW